MYFLKNKITNLTPFGRFSGWIMEGRLERERHSESERKTPKERKCEELKERLRVE